MASRRSRRRSNAQNPLVYPDLPAWHGLHSPVIAHVFDELTISVSLWISEDFWHAIHVIPNITAFEDHHHVAARRWAHNFRTFERVKSSRRAIRAEHAGFFDLFVPVQRAGKLCGILVTGPYALARPTSADLAKRWYWLSRQLGKLSDPSFAEYVSQALGTLTLPGALSVSFERLMVCFSELLSDQGDAAALANESRALYGELLRARQAERMWETCRTVIDEGSATKRPENMRIMLREVGVLDVPEHVIVGLLSPRAEERDPVDGFLRREQFQRECVELAMDVGNVVSGKVAEHGVVFLLLERGARARVRSRVATLTRRAEVIAQRLGFTLNVGLSTATDPLAVSAAYRAALWAAEKALTLRLGKVFGESRSAGSAEQVIALQSELESSIEERLDLLSTRFERYVEAVLVHSAHRLDVTRAELEIGVERLLQPMLRAGAIEPKGAQEIRAALAMAGRSAESAGELVGAYRKVVSEIEATMRKPVATRQERGTGRAVSYLREHLGKPITLAKAARVAGLAPSHFARLFRRNEGTSFGQYVRSLRLQRASELLRSSPLTVEQIQKLCGFRSRTTFYRAFIQGLGMTPAGYRAAHL